jgi:hypothetical protein
MKINIREARISDAPSFILIKEQLSFKNINGTNTKGGFLLGTNLKEYKNFITNDFCLVAEIENKIIGFGIVLKNESVMKSDIWLKRNQVSWAVDFNKFPIENICYFEQLAFLNNYSLTVIKLAYKLINMAFENHSVLITTTLNKPILNLAAVPYILKVGGAKIGFVNEIYPEIGPISSDVYLIERSKYRINVLETKWNDFLNRE